MYVDIVPNRSSPPAILLRESYREDGKVKKRTVANLSAALSVAQAEQLKLILKGETLVPAGTFEVTASRSHGAVDAVLTAMKQLDVAGLLAARSSRERSLVLLMIAMRILKPGTKLAMTRTWGSTTLLSELGLAVDTDENDLYSAMDWLIGRKDRIEQKLAGRHLSDGSLALFDMTSSYVEGSSSELAEFGYSRDKKRGKAQVNWGLLTDSEGRPVALDVFPGNVRDSGTLLPQVRKLKDRFSLENFILVGDRGMITGKHIKELHAEAGVDWVTALASQSIRPLVRSGVIQQSLFEETNLFEIEHADYPGERLIACRNPVLGRKRAYVRAELIAATVTELEKVRKLVLNGKLTDAGKIGVRVGRVVNNRNMQKHFDLTIDTGVFEFEINQASVTEEAAMDGLYIIRTSVSKEKMTAGEAVTAYKRLTSVERAFRTSKSLEMQVRPIHHWLDDRVKTHLFICMLAYYVRWHMQEAWKGITFQDDEKPKHTDPVAAAERSEAADRKASRRTLPDGTRTHSFKTLLDNLASITRNTCTYPAASEPFEVTTSPNAEQQNALALLKNITL